MKQLRRSEAGDADISRAAQGPDGRFEARVLVPGLSTAASDARPNLRHEVLEIFVGSNAALLWC